MESKMRVAEIKASQSQIPTKRRRKGEEGFVKGSIVEVYVQNFLTYDECTFRLNPKLNVIIGPNGTGKSSIVCAICLGLAGKTNVLARAKELGDFIKHGHTNAVIQIELANKPKNEVIRREISMNSSGKVTSTWKVNGAQSSVSKVEELVRDLNIQLFNLCQFLPQERVADFAKMNKIELLENTELAICPVSMQKDHEWLKEFRTEEKQMETQIADDKNFLDKLVQKNERVQKEVERYKERNALVGRLKNLEQKRAWTIYEDARCEYLKCKETHQKLVKLCKEEEKKAQPLTAEKEKFLQRMTAMDKLMKSKGEALKMAASLTKRLHDQLNDKDEEVTSKWDDFKEKEKDEEIRHKRMDQFKLQISGWKKELEQLQDCDVQSEIDQVNASLRATVAEITEAEDQTTMAAERKQQTHREVKGKKLGAGQAVCGSGLLPEDWQPLKPARQVIGSRNCDGRISELNNMSKRRLEILKRRNRDCHNAVLWLRKNKDMFRRTVHEPILLLLKMKNPAHAELIENHIAMRDMFAFVCEDHDDNKRFIHEVREKMGLRINVVRAPLNGNRIIPPSSYQPQRRLEDIRRWGFVSYLRESIDAPDAVMSYLCKQYRVQDIPVGTAETKRIVDQVTQSSGFSLFFIPTGSTPGCRYSVRTSKYSGQQIVGNSALRRSEFMSINVNPDEIADIERQKQTLLEKLTEENESLKSWADARRKLERKDNELKQRKKELYAKKNSRKNLENKIMLKEKSLQDLEQSGADLEALKEEVKRSVGEVLLKKKELAIKFVAKIKGCVETSIEKGTFQVDYACALKRKALIEERIHQIKMKNQELIRDVERSEAEKSEAQSVAKGLLSEARRLTGGGPDKLDPECSELPDELAEIEAKIHECQARLECCGSTDPKAVGEFKTRSKEIAKLEGKVSRMSGELQAKRDEMAVIKARWLDPLKKLVSKINERFAKYFEKMGCAGEVDLYTENEDDFDKYGIRIRVKFRSTSSLQELNPFRQSGGERSVSTMLYLVALQSMYVCPFRVVDEINQGMDPHNERRVFEVIVNTSSEETKSQYFLITPKLLPRLTYNKHMSIHCIVNGPNTVTSRQWKVARFVRKRSFLKFDDTEEE